MNRRSFMKGAVAVATSGMLPAERLLSHWIDYGIDLAEPGADVTVLAFARTSWNPELMVQLWKEPPLLTLLRQGSLVE